MKKFFTLIAAAFVAMSVNAEPKQLIWVGDGGLDEEGGVCIKEGGQWSTGIWFNVSDGNLETDLTQYDYTWITYNADDLEGSGLRFTIGYDEYTGYASWGQELFASEAVTLNGNHSIMGIKIDKTSKITSKSSGDPDHEKIASDFAGDLYAQHVTTIFLQNTANEDCYVEITGIYLGTEAEYLAAMKENGEKVYVYGDAKDVLEGKDMASYIRVQIGPDGAVAKDQPANGGVEDGVATINVRSKEDALGDRPTFSQWYGSYNAEDESTWTAENVATWDTQGFIKLPAAISGLTKFSVSLEAKAEKALSGVSVGIHAAPGAYITGYGSAPTFNIGTDWTTYEIPEAIVDKVGGSEDFEFQSIAFDLTMINSEISTSTSNVVQFRNVKVMVSEATEAGEETGIKTVYELTKNGWVRYNLAGQKVDKSYKGIVIENGKKFIQK